MFLMRSRHCKNCAQEPGEPADICNALIRSHLLNAGKAVGLCLCPVTRNRIVSLEVPEDHMLATGQAFEEVNAETPFRGFIERLRRNRLPQVVDVGRFLRGLLEVLLQPRLWLVSAGERLAVF